MRQILAAVLLPAVLLVVSSPLESQNARVPHGSKIFIAPMEGELNGFIATEIIKQKLPVKIVSDDAAADYVLTGASLKADDKWYNTVFGGKDKNEGNVQLLDLKEKAISITPGAPSGLVLAGWVFSFRARRG